MGDPSVFAEYPSQRVVVRRPFLSDIEDLAANLRYDDRRELEAHGCDAETGILESLKVSTRAFVVEQCGKPVLIFGVSTTSQDGEAKTGGIWLLATTRIKGIARLFVRHSKEWMAEMAQGYDLLWNQVDARNKLHHRWLQWCGCVFLREVKIGPHPFYEFVYKPCAQRPL